MPLAMVWLFIGCLMLAVLVIYLLLRYTSFFKSRSERAKALLTVRKTEAWQTFAEKYGLTYIPGETIDKAQVKGQYRTCRFLLKTEQQLTDENVLEITTIRLSCDTSSDTAKNRPLSPKKIKSLLTLTDFPVQIKGYIDITANGNAINYTQPNIEYDRIYLQVISDYLYQLLNIYPILVNSKDTYLTELQAIARYKGLALQPFARRMMGQMKIPAPKKSEIRLICPTCLVSYGEAVNSALDGDFNSDVGCRICGNRQGYFAGKMVAVLNRDLTTDIEQVEGELRVNWLKHQHLLDFDEIEIVQATDEDVERFVVQVGNNSDADQKSRYANVTVTISPSCELSGNTQRILKRMFQSYFAA